MEMLRVPPVKAPSDLSAAINRRIQSRERQSAPPRRALTTGLILGSSFVAAGCLVLLFSLLGVDFLSLPANIHEHLTLLFSNLSVSLDSLFSSLSNLSSLFPSL